MLRLATDQDDPDRWAETVAALASRARAAGMEVTCEEVGEPAALPAKVERALHRIVQESLTNASKHAPGAPVSVRVTYDEAETRVNVGSGPRPSGPTTAIGSGSGLIGLQERVRLLGGTLRAEPDARGGFLVDAGLPHSAAALEPAASESTRRRAEGQRRLRRTVVAALALPGLLGGAVLLGAYLVAR